MDETALVNMDVQVALQERHPIEPVSACVHDLVLRENVAKWPQREAICAWDGTLTYASLDALSSAFATRLQGLGVEPESYVPLCCVKSKWAVVAMLGILKAGGAFVPLDESHPPQRCLGILRDVDAKVMVVSGSVSAHFAALELGDVEIVSVDGESAYNKAVLEFQDPARSGTRVNARCPVYAIYTSGSTGIPKGVVLEHQAVSTALVGMRAAFDCDSTTRMLQFASFTFDACIAEIFVTLLAGGCVCIPSADQRKNDLPTAMETMRVSYANLTPSVTKLLRPSDLPSLKTLICAGEAITPSIIDTWVDKVNLMNAYGPTEASVCSVSCRITSQEALANVIGTPMACRTWVARIDDHDRLVGIGEVGELLIEGPTLARGYLNDKAKTSMAFVSPKWRAETELQDTGRVYKTGDLAKIELDGSLIYVGRKDDQVKLHGQRVEMGEIEHYLSKNSQIRQSLVAVPKTGPYKGRLVAVLVLEVKTACRVKNGEEPPSGVSALFGDAELVNGEMYEDQLKHGLPPYMIPATWISVDSLAIADIWKDGSEKQS